MAARMMTDPWGAFLWLVIFSLDTMLQGKWSCSR